ncbi:hypothetical protein POM88_022121 [Heracleum sosnowskyi]|uniref:Uncharacterized protein n=1 Tax=Heracleum sosnowskyi TaxID=360622 RepID=A0AAD8IG89_9APIA|nr:hypothetical protein POM88_022121 [Heracleum sosnowskyi]
MQNFQSHSLVRASSVGLPSSSQSLQPHNQPWLPSGSQGKPPLPPTQFRPPSSTQPSQQRSVLPLHHLPIANAQQQQQQISPGQQSQSALSHQQQEHYGQQFPPSRIQQSVPHQQQITRGQGTGNQKISSQPMIQSSAIQQNPSGAAAAVGSGESCSRILSKRSIHELVAQDGLSPIDLMVETETHRATPGGTGCVKTIGNYAAVLKAQSSAKAKGYSDVLYLDHSCAVFYLFHGATGFKNHLD